MAYTALELVAMVLLAVDFVELINPILPELLVQRFDRYCKELLLLHIIKLGMEVQEDSYGFVIHSCITDDWQRSWGCQRSRGISAGTMPREDGIY